MSVVCALVTFTCLAAGFATWTIRAFCLSGRDEAGVSPAAPADLPTRAEVLRTWLTTEMEPTLTQSRGILLGQRYTASPTCITQRLDDNRVVVQANPTGGAGERMMAFYDKAPRTPLALYSWYQKNLRSYLQAERKANTLALARAERMATAARELASEIHKTFGPSDSRGVDGQTAWLPASDLRLPETQFTATAWPAECLRQLETALAAGNASAAQTWADELAAATFGLADLHRWLDLLLSTHLTSLDFQARCRAAFVYAESAFGSGQKMSEASLPAGGLMIAWGQNYLEVEHQAEGLFFPPDTAVESVTAIDLSGIPAARWMPPEVRPAFRWLRARLSPTVQAVWDRAATTPFDRSYLANMLFRAMSARSLDEMGVALQRFEQSHTTVTQAELMDVLFYRSGFYSSGYLWADRYDRRIVEEAAKLLGDQEKAARQAQQLTNHLLMGWANYRANVMTLTDSLNIGKLDCVSGTDMIGALYRDAGHGEYFVVRLRCGTAGHSVGAIPVVRDGQRKLLILDCLQTEPPGEVWPSAFFQDIRWPQGYPGSRGPLFSAELYVRGLDGYLFAAGYVVRDESAGQLVRAALPYVPTAPKAGVTQAFAGPYPSPIRRDASACLRGFYCLPGLALKDRGVKCCRPRKITLADRDPMW